MWSGFGCWLRKVEERGVAVCSVSSALQSTACRVYRSSKRQTDKLGFVGCLNDADGSPEDIGRIVNRYIHLLAEIQPDLLWAAELLQLRLSAASNAVLRARQQAEAMEEVSFLLHTLTLPHAPSPLRLCRLQPRHREAGCLSTI